MEVPERVYQRIIRQADRNEEGCLVSRYSIGSHGYAQIGWSKGLEKPVVTTAHRAVWIYLEGEIPDGLVVDHTCHNRRCVEYGHLRLLTNFENARRNSGQDWPLGFCGHGHPDSELRTYGKDGTRRRCRLCAQRHQRDYIARKKGL